MEKVRGKGRGGGARRRTLKRIWKRDTARRWVLAQNAELEDEERMMGVRAEETSWNNKAF